MAASVFGISVLQNFIGVYSYHGNGKKGLVGWFREDVLDALLATPDEITVAFRACDLSSKWAGRFQDRGHKFIVFRNPKLIGNCPSSAQVAKAMNIHFCETLTPFLAARQQRSWFAHCVTSLWA